MRKSKNRLIWDDCSGTMNRAPSTLEERENDIHLVDFKNSQDLVNKLIKLAGYEEAEDELESEITSTNAKDAIIEKALILAGVLSDPTDGSPNILYMCIDGKDDFEIIDPYDCLDELNLRTCTEKAVKRAIMEEEAGESFNDFYAENEDEDDEEDEGKKYIYPEVSDLLSDDGKTLINIRKINVGLETLDIPDSVKKIEPGAFQNWEFLKSINIPDSVEEIGRNAFSGCSRLKSITLPDSIKEIATATFSGCRSLRSVNIPDSVKVIGVGAFDECLQLESITIPDSVEEIGEYAFDIVSYRFTVKTNNKYVINYCSKNKIRCEPLKSGIKESLTKKKIENSNLSEKDISFIKKFI